MLFYQALHGTGGAAGAAPITAGLVVVVAALVAVFVATERFGVRVPLRPFFGVTGSLLFTAVVVVGRGVSELQEGSWLGATPVPAVPASAFLGIHSTLESLAAQGVLVAALLAALAWTFLVRPEHAEAD